MPEIRLDPQLLIQVLAGGCLALALLVVWLVFSSRAKLRLKDQDVLLLQTKLAHTQLDIARLDAAATSAQQEQRDLSADNTRLQADLIRTEERSRESLRAAGEKIDLLKAAREQMTAEFNHLANRIFDEKTDRLLQSNKSSMESTLNPLKTQLNDFRKKVEDVYDKETRDRVSLRVELEQLKQLNSQLSQDAVNLTKALKGDKKIQGNWGEIVLERVLEHSGLRKGSEYETQVHLQSDEGGRQMPDVIIRLPDSRDVVVDAKMSLVDYEQYVNAESEPEKEAALQRHVSAINNHISGLSRKSYEKLDGIRSLDFVLMFVPIESAFSTAYDANPELFLRASRKQIIVVSPTTLLVTLRTIQTIWRYEYQNRNAEKIAAQAGGIFDQFALVIESLDEVGRNLDRARDSFDLAHKRISSGKGNLARRVQHLEALGARTKKKLPASVIEGQDEAALVALNLKNDGKQKET